MPQHPIIHTEDGKFAYSTELGLYPLYHILDDGESLCPSCANDPANPVHVLGDNDGWRIIATDINYEDPELFCAHCNTKIPSAYTTEDEDMVNTNQDGYNFNSQNIITDPGKFENSPRFAPHFSNFAEDGEILSTLEDGLFASLIEVDDEDKKLFPELNNVKYVVITESESGFVSAQALTTEAEAEEFRAEFANNENSNSDDEDEI